MSVENSRNTSEQQRQMEDDGEAPNPFEHQLDLPWYRIPQLAVMSVSIAPLRLVSLGMVNLFCWIVTNVTLLGLSDDDLKSEPLTGWRRHVRTFVHWMGRLSIACGGFQYVKIKGRRASRTEAPIFVIAPHSTLLDGVFIFLMNECPGVIAKHETIHQPFIGKLLKFTQPILVYRDDKNSRQNVIDELKKRAHSGGAWHQSLIFPEGTTTNRKALLPFKAGAFIPGKPVQPVTVQYTDCWDTTTWTWLGGPPGWALFWMSMCKLNIGLTLNFLPVYYPSEEEINDPSLYAENVRRVMARSLNVPCSPLDMNDAKRMLKERKRSKRKST